MKILPRLTPFLACLGLVALANVGCYSFEPKPMLGGRAAADLKGQTALIADADGVRCTSINGERVKETLRFTPDQGNSVERYLVPAGPCTLVVEYSNSSGTTSFRGVPKTLRFTAEPGKTYELNSYVNAAFHSGTLQNDQWDARVRDTSAKDKTTFVAQTADAKK